MSNHRANRAIEYIVSRRAIERILATTASGASQPWRRRSVIPSNGTRPVLTADCPLRRGFLRTTSLRFLLPTSPSATAGEHGGHYRVGRPDVRD
jgi:hypothetical protein